MSVGQGSPYDFILQDSEANPKVELGLTLAYDETGVKQWREGRVPPLPPRRSEGALSWTHKDPISDFVFSQTSWVDGAFQPYYANDEPRRYAKSHGIDLRWDGVAALGPRRGPIRTGGTVLSKIQSNVFFANGDWEEGQTAGWSAGTGTAITINTSTVRTGEYSGQAIVSQGTSAGDIVTQAIPNPTVYRSREITVCAYVRRAAGSNAGILLRIDDGVATASSSTVTADTWTYVSATITVNGSASALTIRFRTSATLSTDAHTFRIDDVSVVPTGGITCSGTAIRSSTDPDQLYVAFGRCITLWDESSFTHEAVYIDSADTVTDLIEYDNNIYAAFGESDGSTPRQYVYGNSTTWTTAAISATTTHQDNHARFWVKARNGFGNWVLWKSSATTNQGTERNGVSWSDNPTNTGTWSPTSYFVVGKSDRHITGLYPFRDTFVVGKVDGLWIWDGLINDFIVITPEWENSADEENASIGQLWHNDLYVVATRQGFFRYGGDELEDLAPLLIAPRLVDFGGRVTAMTASARELIIGLDQPIADTSTTKTSRLVRLRLAANGAWQLHTTQEPDMGIIDKLTMHRSTRLWAFGRIYDSNLSNYVARTTVWIEPDKSAAPYADVTPEIESTGYFETSIWNGGMPETSKAFIALTIWCEDLDSNHTIQVHYGRDGRAANDAFLGTFSKTERTQTLFFKNAVNPVINAIGRFVQLRFTFTTSNTVSPKLYAFALHTQLVPDPIRLFTLSAFVGGQTQLRTGVPHELTKSEIEAIFLELEAQVFPLTMLDDFGQTHGGGGTDGARVRQVRLIDYAREPQSDEEGGQERWQLLLQEVAIS